MADQRKPLATDDAAFDAVAIAGETAAKATMKRVIERRAYRHYHPCEVAGAVALGTLIQAGRLLHAIAGNHEVAERLAVANLPARSAASIIRCMKMGGSTPARLMARPRPRLSSSAMRRI